jgi:pseudouridine-5'-phosphate glycosidase
MNFLKIKHFNPQKTFLNYSKTRHFSSQINNKLLENNIVEISDEIKHSNRPMVALESTIITHGLPYPANLEMALDVENEIKSVGAVPATVAFLNGRFRVGLSRQEIEFLAKSNKDAIKISRRDIPFLLSTNNRDYCIVGGRLVFLFCDE